ncbi:MAG: ATP-dependent zinc metalloprotease FtsH [Acidimicrobiales bacterium]
MRKLTSQRSPILIAGAFLLLVIILVTTTGDGSRTELTFSELEDRIVSGEVVEATIRDRSHEVVGVLDTDERFRASFPAEATDELFDELRAAEPAIEIDIDRQAQSVWTRLLFSLLPILILVGVFMFFISSMSGGRGGGIFSMGKSRARRLTKDEPSVTFADVAGVDEAIDELTEIRDFLSEPKRFQDMGARIPKGVLLYGPPGTGKTLLARAVAGEAGVPFFTISGSDFVEMFVGVGASRVRDLFEQAKAEAPAIIFVDEIDAVGRQRGAGHGGGHDEREQTLNQLLVEMDGFDVETGVILIAATNRPDILDPALLRPGRFDRQIVVDRPDLEGRRRIVAVHAKGKPFGGDVSTDVIAARTPGFTGADLANLLNEAALLAARRDLAAIGQAEIEDAIDRVIAGPERKTRAMSDKEKTVIAYHEAGHALVGHVLPNADPIHKVSIIARGRALGWTLSLPTEDKYLKSRAELGDEMAMLLGGRTAEELIFGDPTTGAANDIEQVAEIARAMITEYGMSDELGPQKLGIANPETFLGRDNSEANYSDGVAAVIDREVRGLVQTAHDEAREILTIHRSVLDRLAEALIDHETIEGDVLDDILAGVGGSAPDTPSAATSRHADPSNTP